MVAQYAQNVRDHVENPQYKQINHQTNAKREEEELGAKSDGVDEILTAEVEKQIQSALDLDLCIRPRPNLDGNGIIIVDEQKNQTNEHERGGYIHAGDKL